MTGRKRNFTRSSVQVEINVSVNGHPLSTGEISDISLGGLYVPCSGSPELGTRCDVVLHIGGRHTGIRAMAIAEVVRTDETGIGIAFRELLGTESLHHLRQLVLLNSGDPEQTEHEFLTHLGIKNPTEAQEMGARTGEFIRGP